MVSPSTSEARATRSRERIMRALAELAAEDGIADFSVQEVADRAGVAHRTVYRHYGSREALLDGLARWLDEQLVAQGGVATPIRSGELPEAAGRVFALFDELGPLVEALVVVALGTRSRVRRRQERTGEFRQVLEEGSVTAHLAPREAEAVIALIRILASSNTWFLFRHQHDIDGERAGAVVAWALCVLLDELRGGGGPDGERADRDARDREDA